MELSPGRRLSSSWRTNNRRIIGDRDEGKSSTFLSLSLLLSSNRREPIYESMSSPSSVYSATFMGPYGGRRRNGDRFIKHPTARTLVVTNQLNWIVWAQCFSGLRCNRAIYVGTYPRAAPPRQTNVAAEDRYGRTVPETTPDLRLPRGRPLLPGNGRAAV